MGVTPSNSLLSHLPSAFAAACRSARTEAELFERCRNFLVQRFLSERIWFTITGPAAALPRVGPDEGHEQAQSVATITSGGTQVAVMADPTLVAELRTVALPLVMALSMVTELRTILIERQAALDDAGFQLRALRNVARLLSSVHSTEETEQLVLDFMAEVFFAWWACLFRPDGAHYHPRVYRSLNDRRRPSAIERTALDGQVPAGSAALRAGEVGVAQLVGPGAELVVPLDAGSERMAMLVLGPRISDKPYGRPELELAGTLSFAAAIALKNSELVEQLQSAASTDELTGLYNRRALEERLAAEFSRSLRHQLHSTALLVDLDHFKKVNDDRGHAAGDRMLVEVAKVLKRECRTLDVVGRLGGDEFLVILPMTQPEEALVFVSRVQSGLARLEEQHPEMGRCTASFGLAECPRHGSSVASVLAAADAALYQAKRGGRNAVSIAEA